MQTEIVLYPGFTALDVIGPYEVLWTLPGMEVRFVWHEPGPVTADSGVLVVGATHSFAETPVPDVVLVSGGTKGVLQAAADKELLAWLSKVDATTTWTTSVCAGSLVLGAAGLLRGKKATSHWSAIQALRAYGAIPQPQDRVVHEGKVVTSAGVSAGIDLALWLAGQIAGRDRAEAVQLVIEYDPQPPFDAGHMSKASTKAKALAAAWVAKESTTPAAVLATGKLLWDQALARARSRRRR